MRKYQLMLMLAGLGIFGGCTSIYERPEAAIDTTLDLKLQALRLAQRVPQTSWQSTVSYPEVDDYLPVGDDQVLLGMRDLKAGTLLTTTNYVAPSYGPYVLYDTKEGREIWRSPRTETSKGIYNVIPAAGVFIVQHQDDKKTTLTAIDRTTGSTLWERSLPSRQTVAVSPEASLLIAATSGPQGSIATLDLLTGSTRWTAPISFTTDTLPTLQLVGKQLLVIHRDAAAFSLVTGSLDWRVADVGPVADSAAPFELPSKGLVIPADTKLTLIAANGTSSWTVSMDGQVRTVVCATSTCYAESEDAAGKRSLSAVLLDQGKVLWKQALDNDVYSQIAVTTSSLVLTTEKRLEILDSTDGTLRRSAPLPSARAGRLPDRVIVTPNNIFVAMEDGICAFNVADLSVLWSYLLRGQQDHVYEVVSTQLKTAMERFSDRKLDSQAKAKVDLRFSRMSRAINDSFRSYYDENLRRAGEKVGVKNSSAHPTSLDYRGFALAMEAKSRFEREAAVRELTAIIEDVGGTLVNAYLADAGEKAKRVSTLDRLNARASDSLQSHRRALIDHYYVRPFVGGAASGVLIVDLNNGTWCEIATSPREPTETSTRALNSIPAIITPNGVLVSKGTGFDTARWQRDDRYRRVITVQRSILGYDLSKLQFQRPETYEIQSLAR